jgi:hypothetical protein
MSSDRPASVTTTTARRPRARELRQAWHVPEKLPERRYRVRVWEALEEGQCAACGAVIEPGQQLTREVGGGWLCRKCRSWEGSF